MSQSHDPLVRKSPGQPPLDVLMTRYLQRQAEAHMAGLAVFDPAGEVQPFEAGPVQPIDAKAAWPEAITAGILLHKRKVKEDLNPPIGWPSLVSNHEPAFDLAFAIGNFPQLVRDLLPLMQAENLVELRKKSVRKASQVPELEDWAKEIAVQNKFPQRLLAVGSLRLAKNYDFAVELIETCPDVPEEWQDAWKNERAALDWHRGEEEAARRQWLALAPSAPVLFNRGMSALFLDQVDDAREPLFEAVAQLPESSSWHHLARLYLTMAETRD